MKTNGGDHSIKVVGNVQQIKSYNRTKILVGSTEVFDSRSSAGGEIGSSVPHFNRGFTAYQLAAAYKGVVIKAATSATANLTEWQGYGGNLLANVGPDGSIGTSGTISASGGLVLNDLVPNSVTNALYNDGGTLKFNGSTVGGGGGGSVSGTNPSGIAFFDNFKAIDDEPHFIYDSTNRGIIVDGSTSSSATDCGGVTMTTNGGNHELFVEANIQKIRSYNKTKIYVQTSEVFNSNGGSDIGNHVPSFPRGLVVYPFNSAYKGSIIKGLAHQSANLTEWQSSSDVVVASVGADGSIFSSGDISVSGQLFIPGGGGTSAPTLCFTGSSNRRVGFYEKFSDQQIAFCAGGRNRLIMGDDRLQVGNASYIGWSSSAVGEAQDGTDTNFKRNSAGVIGVHGSALTDDRAKLGQILASGLTASGVELVNHVPVSTTNRLYNDGGTLKFNGSAVGGGGGSMSNFILEDDDGTEVTVSDGKEVKIIGDGITTNWTDVSDGSDGDPYDLTLSVDAAQTNITSILATDVKIGEDDQTKIDFETEDEIHFYAANAEQVYVADGVFGPQTDSDVDLGATSVRWKDAYVDSITTTDKITAGGSINQAPNTATDGGIVDIDCSTSNYHEILMNADATRINFTNVTAGQRVIVRFKQHSSHIDLNSSEGFNDVDVNGGNATIKWAGGIVPTLTESNNAVDVYGFIFESTVTNVMAFIIGQDIK
jgi:hypothetical protein